MNATENAAIEERIDELRAEIDALRSENDELRERVDEQADRIDGLEREVESKDALIEAFRKRFAKMNAMVADLQERFLSRGEEFDGELLPGGFADFVSNSSIAAEFEQVELSDGSTRVRVPEFEQVEPEAEAASGGMTETESAAVSGESSLYQITALPEHVADEELTKNQQRARFIAKGLDEYARSVPAGRVIDSPTIRKVISAAEGSRAHTETVSRVIDFLDELGGSDVTVRKRHGKRVVAFDPDEARRYATNHTRCDQPRASEGGNDVIGAT